MVEPDAPPTIAVDRDYDDATENFVDVTDPVIVSLAPAAVFVVALVVRDAVAVPVACAVLAVAAAAVVDREAFDLVVPENIYAHPCERVRKREGEKGRFT